MGNYDDSSKGQVEEPAVGTWLERTGGVEQESHSWIEYHVPLILFSLGLIGVIGAAIALAGADGIKWAATYVGALLLLQVPLTIVGMYVVGAVFGISYGLLKSAVLKLAAIQMVVAAITLGGLAMGHPFIALLILAPIASWGLFAVLFDLDGQDLVYSAIGLWALGWIFRLLLDAILGDS
jgi:hypothetical protein